MAGYTGGEKVPGGYYWNTRGREVEEVEVVPAEGGRLRSMDGARYVKVPLPALLVAGPLLGALFLVLLPFVGLTLLARAVVKKVAGGVGRGATELAATVQPGRFAAGSAHFTGEPGEEREGAAGEPARGGELTALEEEIGARRERE